MNEFKELGKAYNIALKENNKLRKEKLELIEEINKIKGTCLNYDCPYCKQANDELIKELIEKIETLIKKIFYHKAKDIHPPFKEYDFPIVSLDHLQQFEKAIKQLKLNKTSRSANDI